MTLDELRALPVTQTSGIARAEAADDGQTHNYIVDCIMRLYAGDYGTIPPEDTESNNADLTAGEGRIIARYDKAQQLQGDIYIIANFSREVPGQEANYIMILYCREY